MNAKIGSSPPPTNNPTTAAKETAPTTTKPTPDPDADVPLLGSKEADAAATFAADLVTMGTFSRSKAVVDGAAKLIGIKSEGAEAVSNIREAYQAIDQLKPGDEVEIGRKLTLEVEDGVEGENEVKVSVERDAEGYLVTLEQSGMAGVGAEDDTGGIVKAEVGAGVGVTGSVSIRVKTAEEAKALVDKGVGAMAAGVVAPGADTIALVATAMTADDAPGSTAKISSVSVSVDGGISGGIGLDTKDVKSGLGLKVGVGGEVTESKTLTYERGPPSVVYYEEIVEFEGSLDGGIAGDHLGLESGHDLTEGKVTMRIPITVDDQYDPNDLKTAAGRQKILEKAAAAKAADQVEVIVEGKVHAGPLVVEVERRAKGATVKEALVAFASAKTETEVFREKGPHKVTLGFKAHGEAGGAAVEVATNTKEAVSGSDRLKALALVTASPEPPPASPQSRGGPGPRRG